VTITSARLSGFGDLPPGDFPFLYRKAPIINKEKNLSLLIILFSLLIILFFNQELPNFLIENLDPPVHLSKLQKATGKTCRQLGSQGITTRGRDKVGSPKTLRSDGKHISKCLQIVLRSALITPGRTLHKTAMQGLMQGRH
jgi:hypothetical protein